MHVVKSSFIIKVNSYWIPLVYLVFYLLCDGLDFFLDVLDEQV